MAINKVVFGNNTLIDLTSDTIGADKLLKGFTAHDASGASIVGTYEGGSVDGYTINLFASSSELYGQSIVVSYEGQRVTTIQFSNAGTASIVVQEEGAYNFAVSYGGLTYYCDVNVVSAVRTYNETIYYYPNGSTVTPINDVQIWISCADVRDKNYTTLAEVFADNQLLATLMSSENAVNYLVRSKQFIKSEALVPVMTSNTTPEGLAFAYGELSGYEAYRAFDNDDSTFWQGRPSAINGTIGYCFDSPVNISRVKYRDKYGNKQVTISYSDNGTDYTIASDSATITSGDADYYFDTNVTSNHRYWRANITANESSNFYVSSLQFYTEDGVTQNQTAMLYIGASDYASETLLSDSTWLSAIDGSAYKDYVINASVPTMTGYTTPKGEVIYSTIQGSYLPWYAFDGTSNHYEPVEIVGSYIGYKFEGNTKIYKVGYQGATSPYQSWSLKDFKVQGSADNVTWEDIETLNYSGSNLGQYVEYSLSQLSEDYKYFRLYCVSGNGGGHIVVTKAQFYGRENAGVQTWLRKAGIIDKLYTTLAEVLSDTTTLEELIKNKDAVDYLVTCKGWAEQICADQNAMYYIGQNNYCANTLLADETWREAICNSTYKTSVLNVTNPNMTDNTHPYGVCFASSVYSSDYAEWKAFTGSIDTRGWNCNSSEYNKLDQAYVGYEFTSAVKVCMIEFIYNSNSTAVSSSEVRVVANDNSADAWNVMSDVYTGTGTGQTERKIIVNSYAPYKRIALKGSFYQGSTRYFAIAKAIIYGRKDISEPTGETLLYKDGTQYVTLNNRISGSSNASSFQESYIQCNYYSSSGSGFVSTEGFDITGKKYFKLNFKLANSAELQHQHCMVADLEYFLKQGITSLKFGFRYSGNGCVLYLVDSQYDINPSNTNTKYVSGCVSGGNNYIVVDKIWLE